MTANAMPFPKFWPLGRTEETSTWTTTRYYEVTVNGLANHTLDVNGSTKLSGWSKTASFKVVFECSSFDGTPDAQAIRSAIQSVSIETQREFLAWDPAFQAIITGVMISPKVVKIVPLTKPRRRPSHERDLGFVFDYVAGVRDHFKRSLSTALGITWVEAADLRNSQ